MLCLPWEKSLPKDDFDKLLIEAVDEGLASLGESPKQAIYFHLEKNFKIQKREIPSKIETFVDAFEKIFGSPGASFLEVQIMRRLHEKLGRTVQLRGSKDFTFTEYITAAKQSFLKKRKSTEQARELEE